MNFYLYRLMIRQGEVNHILMCHRFFHQFVVDMYVKIKTYLRLVRPDWIDVHPLEPTTATSLEEYIHLRDAVNADGNVNNVGRMTCLPANYIVLGSPRHMHEYAQDAMSYVRHHGCPELFVTFTCNPKWSKIERELLHSQTPVGRHDITARSFLNKK